MLETGVFTFPVLVKSLIFSSINSSYTSDIQLPPRFHERPPITT
jgi:hypothetical protein